MLSSLTFPKQQEKKNTVIAKSKKLEENSYFSQLRKKTKQDCLIKVELKSAKF